jgi:SRSO17 transposase
MEPRFDVRKREMQQDCHVDPKVFEGQLDRLVPFAQPFLDLLSRREQREHGRTYMAGLLSDLERKNTEAIAYYFDQDRRPLQTFIGTSPWDSKPLFDELATQVGRELGRPDGVLVFDPSGFPKKGQDSVGVQRQWLGRLGKVDNGQVAVYLGYVSAAEHALVDVRLYLPRDWAKDKARRRKTGVPKEVRYKTRHQLALDMLAQRGGVLPHSWVAGDDEMGRSSKFRGALRELGERYLLAVPSNTTVRDLEAEPPEWSGRGPRPKVPFVRACDWAASVPPEDWQRVEVRPGDKGPLWVELVSTRVVAKADKGKIGPEELLVVTRTLQEDGEWKHDYYLSNASHETPGKELARVAKAEHEIEECIQRGKSEAGLADYEVRTWAGWYHHQVLSLIAGWFLVKEVMRGKVLTPALTVPQVRWGLAVLLAAKWWGGADAARVARYVTRQLIRNEEARFYHWKKLNILPPRRLRVVA